MITTIPTDVRDLRPGDRVMLCNRMHRVHRNRQVRLHRNRGGAFPQWMPGHDADGNPLFVPATELLTELLTEPGLICTAIPHGAKICVVLPI